LGESTQLYSPVFISVETSCCDLSQDGQPSILRPQNPFRRLHETKDGQIPSQESSRGARGLVGAANGKRDPRGESSIVWVCISRSMTTKGITSEQTSMIQVHLGDPVCRTLVLTAFPVQVNSDLHRLLRAIVPTKGSVDR